MTYKMDVHRIAIDKYELEIMKKKFRMKPYRVLSLKLT